MVDALGCPIELNDTVVTATGSVARVGEIFRDGWLELVTDLYCHLAHADEVVVARGFICD